MMLEIIGSFVVGFLLLVGSGFAVISVLGLLKFNDSMTRLHAPTKVGTVGIGALLLASMCNSFLIGAGSLHELLIMAFLFVTAPISANFIAKVNIHTRSCQATPSLLEGKVWSTLSAPERREDVPK